MLFKIKLPKPVTVLLLCLKTYENLMLFKIKLPKPVTVLLLW